MKLVNQVKFHNVMYSKVILDYIDPVRISRIFFFRAFRKFLCAAKSHALLDLGDCLGRVQPLRTSSAAVQDCVASV